jgi:hypothetical protein
MSVTIGVILLILAVVIAVYGASHLDRMLSRRERGLPKRKRRRIGRKKGNHE